MVSGWNPYAPIAGGGARLRSELSDFIHIAFPVSFLPFKGLPCISLLSRTVVLQCGMPRKEKMMGKSGFCASGSTAVVPIVSALGHR